MNPIANLPATQNVNRPQQSQGYSRQYFGNDEMDEVVLSSQEEQKKKITNTKNKKGKDEKESVFYGTYGSRYGFL